MASISPPGVEVIQEFVSTSPPVIQPTLTTVLVGPAFQSVSAFDDNGNPQDEAFAGTYRDGLGTVTYDLPSRVAEASLIGFEEDVRVFLTYGAEVRELNSLQDEDAVIDGATGTSYTASTRKFVDLSQLFLQVGVEPGDVVRFTWRGEVVDVGIVSVDSDTELTLAPNAIDENLTATIYDVVRNPAEFIFSSAQPANAEVGDSEDYLRFTAQSVQVDGTTPSPYAGASGDNLKLVITDSEHFVAGEDGATGDCIFYSGTLSTLTPGTGAFLTSVGARGDVTDKLLMVGAGGDATAFRAVVQVVSNAQLVIETGEGAGLTAQAWVTLDEASSGVAGSTDGTGNTFTGDAGSTFISDIPNTAGTPDQTTWIEIEGVGTYPVTNVGSNTEVTITGTAATQSLSGQSYTIGLQTSSGSDGSTGALTDFSSISGDFSLLADDSSESVNLEETEAEALSASAVKDADNLTVASAFSSGSSGWSYSIVKTASDLTLSWDPGNERIIVRLKRTDGLSSSTYAEISDAVTDDANPSYNPAVANIVTAALGGTTGTGLVALTGSAVPLTVPFDGGADDEQLLLDADLLGSSTPTASVYVSYKALRVDLSPASANPSLWEVSSQTQREALLGPATADNPLSLAASICLVNSPTRAIKVLGVGAVSASKPNGTSEAYSEAFDFLSSENVHLILPLTLDPSVHQALSAHVTALSQPSQKSERIGLVSSSMPLFTRAVVVGSGTSGNTGPSFAGNAAAEFLTSVDLVAAGAQAGDILVVSALSGADAELDAVNGTTGPLYGLPVTSVKSGDDFVLVLDASGLTSTSWNTLVDVDWALYRPGSSIVQPVDQGEVIAQTSEGFANRRMFHLWPDLCTLDVGGTEQLLPGFYLAAGWAGRANSTSPEFGFSRTSVNGFLSLRHSNTYFSKVQLDRIAGGGTWISIQESQNAPIKCRHQLSTDTSSVEKQEFSITRAVDYTAIYLRQGLDRQVGKFNINQSYLDGLSSTIQGLLRSLVEGGKLRGADLVSVEVDSVRPDKINVVIAIQVLFPANLIEVTLQV